MEMSTCFATNFMLILRAKKGGYNVFFVVGGLMKHAAM